MIHVQLPLFVWLAFYGFLAAIPISLAVAYWLAEGGWLVLCRVLRHRGWDITAEEPPIPTNL